MVLSDLSVFNVDSRLQGTGLLLKSGPFSFRIISDVDSVSKGLRLLYSDVPILESGEFVDFTVCLERSKGIRRYWRSQVKFQYDGVYPFDPLPLEHAFPLLEWSMNWCITTQAHHFLILHSAVIERNGQAVIMPAPPGSGKSTLCAGLVSRGWRLLSDELALISIADCSLVPLCRPISLKNQSIEIIKRFNPDAVFSDVTHDTSKGSVSHMKTPSHHSELIHKTAKPRWIVFPKYVANMQAKLTHRSKANSLIELGRNSFNYMVLGLTGFEMLSNVIDSCDCFDFEYGQLNDAVTVFENLSMVDAG